MESCEVLFHTHNT